MNNREERDWSWSSLSNMFSLSVSPFPGYQHFYLLLIGAVLGVIGGLGAVLFRSMISQIMMVAYGDTTPLGYVFFRGQETWRLWLVPLGSACIIAPVVWIWVEESRGSGIPEVLKAVSLQNGAIRWVVLPAKLLVSSLSIGTIASLGREGPIVQIGSAAGSVMNKIANIPGKHRRLVVACGGAAGLSATFNTPIGGAFFMLEVVLGTFSTERFAPVVIASVVGTVMGQTFITRQPAFLLGETFELVHPVELSAYLVLGLASGVLSIVFIQMIDQIENALDESPVPVIIRPLIGSICLVMIAYFAFPHVAGLGYETIEHLIGALSRATPSEFLSGRNAGFLLALIAVKMIAVGISLGAGFSGGVFSPTLFIGALLGFVVGLGTNQIFPGSMVSVPAAYAIVGMGAVFAGSAKAPITAILMIFEMTHNYEIVLPLLLSCVISALITRFLVKDSIYTARLTREGIDLHQEKEELIMYKMTADDIIHSGDEPVLHRDTTFREIVRDFLQYRTDHLFVVDDESRFEGVISLHQIKSHMGNIDELGSLVRAIDLMETDVPFLYPETRLTEAMDSFWHSHFEELPVVNNEKQRRFLGYVREDDVIGVYKREVLKDRDTLVKLIHEDHGEEVTDYFELPQGYEVTQIPVREEWTGQSIKELHFREQEHVNVIEIKRRNLAGGWDRIADVAEEPLEEEDLLVVLGPREEVEKLE